MFTTRIIQNETGRTYSIHTPDVNHSNALYIIRLSFLLMVFKNK